MTFSIPAVALLLTAALLGTAYAQQRRHLPQGVYHPRLAWLRAGLYFCACLLVSLWSGVLAGLLDAPIATAEQQASPAWWAFVLVYAVVIVVGYVVIWPHGTFTDGRRHHGALSLAYGSFWGLCQGLWFLTLWAWAEKTGLAAGWVAVISYLLIGGYNGVWHRFFWDLHVSPPHNYTEWNARKVLLCHTPNLLLGLCLLAFYGNGALFVLMQMIALAASAWFMRFPAPWDDYTAVPGQERRLSAA